MGTFEEVGGLVYLQVEGLFGESEAVGHEVVVVGYEAQVPRVRASFVVGAVDGEVGAAGESVIGYLGGVEGDDASERFAGSEGTEAD